MLLELYAPKKTWIGTKNPMVKSPMFREITIFPSFSHVFSGFSWFFPSVFLVISPPKSTRLGDCESPLWFRDRHRLPADLLNAEPQRRVPWLRLPRPAGGWSPDGRSRAMVSCFWEVLWIFYWDGLWYWLVHTYWLMGTISIEKPELFYGNYGQIK